jgi:hypothetical protein
MAEKRKDANKLVDVLRALPQDNDGKPGWITTRELAKQLGLRSRDNLRERLAEGIADGLYESKIVWVLNSAGYRTTVPAYRCIEKGKR